MRPVEVIINDAIIVSLPTQELAAEEFSRTLFSLESVLDQLDSQLRTQLQEWSGDARTAYDEAHRQWLAAAKDMTKRLAWLTQVIRTAHGNYASARSTNINMFKGRG